MNLRERFALFGFVKVSGLLTAADADVTLDALCDVTGYTPSVFPGVLSKQIPQFNSHNYGVEIPVFRKLATNPKLLKILREVVGENIKLTQDAVGAMWTAAGYHRDSHFPMERFADEPVNTDDPDRHSVTRVLFYFLPPGVQTRVAVVPCSHKPVMAESGGEGLELSDVAHREVWLPLQHGDCVIFDSRLRHMGPPLSEPRYMVNYTYSLPNDIGREEWYYRHHIRPDLGMEKWSPSVEMDLRASDVWFEDPEKPEVVAALDIKYKDMPRGNPGLAGRVLCKDLRSSRYLKGSKYEYLNEHEVKDAVCPVCQSQDGFHSRSYLEESARSNPEASRFFGTRQKKRCLECGTGFAYPFFKAAELDEYYTQHYWKGRSHLPSSIKLDFTRAKEHYVYLFDALDASKSILDFGCGRGEFPLYLKGLFPEKRIQAFDKSDTSKRLLESENIEFINNLDQCAPIDLFYSSHSLEHVHDLTASMERILALTSESAFLFFEVPNIASPYIFDACDHTPHTYMFSRESFQRLANMHSLDVVSMDVSGPTWADKLRIQSLEAKEHQIYLRVLMRKRGS